MHIVYVTSQYPSERMPIGSPFVVREVESLRQLGIEVTVFPYTGGLNPLKYWQAIRQLRRLLRQEQFDLVHAMFGQCGIVARGQWRLPVVISYGGSDVEGKPSKQILDMVKKGIMLPMSRILSLLVDEVIVVSDHLGRKLPRRSYTVVPAGVDFELFAPIDKQEARQQLGLPENKRLVLFAANPAKYIKRYPLAAKACEIAQETLPDLELIVLQNRPPKDVPVFMSACDALIVTSTNEGSPNVVKEALACNLPVVSVDVGDVRERVAGIDGCIVCDDDDPQTIAAALVEILQTPQRLHAREQIDDLDIRIAAEKIVNVYRKALN